MINDDQKNGATQDTTAQATEPAPQKTRKHGARLSPRKLSPLTRQLIVDEFCATGDMDEVAKAYRVPVRTVDSILHWFSLRKPPGSERRMQIVPGRRLA